MKTHPNTHENSPWHTRKPTPTHIKTHPDKHDNSPWHTWKPTLIHTGTHPDTNGNPPWHTWKPTLTHMKTHPGTTSSWWKFKLLNLALLWVIFILPSFFSRIQRAWRDYRRRHGYIVGGACNNNTVSTSDGESSDESHDGSCDHQPMSVSTADDSDRTVNTPEVTSDSEVDIKTYNNILFWYDALTFLRDEIKQLNTCYF